MVSANDDKSLLTQTSTRASTKKLLQPIHFQGKLVAPFEFLMIYQENDLITPRKSKVYVFFYFLSATYLPL
jgi:hypothetical protein